MQELPCAKGDGGKQRFYLISMNWMKGCLEATPQCHGAAQSVSCEMLGHALADIGIYNIGASFSSYAFGIISFNGTQFYNSDYNLTTFFLIGKTALSTLRSTPCLSFHID
jgi:hypothetical protein